MAGRESRAIGIFPYDSLYAPENPTVLSSDFLAHCARARRCAQPVFIDASTLKDTMITDMLVALDREGFLNGSDVKFPLNRHPSWEAIQAHLAQYTFTAISALVKKTGVVPVFLSEKGTPIDDVSKIETALFDLIGCCDSAEDILALEGFCTRQPATHMTSNELLAMIYDGDRYNCLLDNTKKLDKEKVSDRQATYIHKNRNTYSARAVKSHPDVVKVTLLLKQLKSIKDEGLSALTPLQQYRHNTLIARLEAALFVSKDRLLLDVSAALWQVQHTIQHIRAEENISFVYQSIKIPRRLPRALARDFRYNSSYLNTLASNWPPIDEKSPDDVVAENANFFYVLLAHQYSAAISKDKVEKVNQTHVGAIKKLVDHVKRKLTILLETYRDKLWLDRYEASDKAEAEKLLFLINALPANATASEQVQLLECAHSINEQAMSRRHIGSLWQRGTAELGYYGGLVDCLDVVAGGRPSRFIPKKYASLHAYSARLKNKMKNIFTVSTASAPAPDAPTITQRMLRWLRARPPVTWVLGNPVPPLFTPEPDVPATPAFEAPRSSGAPSRITGARSVDAPQVSSEKGLAGVVPAGSQTPDGRGTRGGHSKRWGRRPPGESNRVGARQRRSPAGGAGRATPSRPTGAPDVAVVSVLDELRALYGDDKCLNTLIRTKLLDKVIDNQQRLHTLNWIKEHYAAHGRDAVFIGLALCQLLSPASQASMFATEKFSLKHLVKRIREAKQTTFDAVYSFMQVNVAEYTVSLKQQQSAATVIQRAVRSRGIFKKRSVGASARGAAADRESVDSLPSSPARDGTVAADSSRPLVGTGKTT